MADSPLRRNFTDLPQYNAPLYTDAGVAAVDSATTNPLSRGLDAGVGSLLANNQLSGALHAEINGDQERASMLRQRGLADLQAAGASGPRVGSMRDVHSASDALELGLGFTGQAAATMAPVIAAAALTRGRLRPAATLGAAYNMEADEAISNQYTDPVLSQLNPEDRLRAARGKGAINAGLESVVPLSLFGKAAHAGTALGRVGRNMLEEAATEGAQELVGYGAEKYLDPNRQLDPMRIADAALSGALGGGGVTLGSEVLHGATGRLLADRPDKSAPLTAEPAAVPDEGPGPVPNTGEGIPLGPEDGAPSTDPNDLYQNLKDRFGPEVDRAKNFAEDVLHGETVGKAKDFMSETFDNIKNAAKDSPTTADFLKNVFSRPEDDAADLVNQEDTPDLAGDTPEQTAQNISARDKLREARATTYAQTLMDDDKTSDVVKERIQAMDGNFADPENQKFVGKVLGTQRMGERLTNGMFDLIDAAKELGKTAKVVGTDAKTKVGELAEDAQDKIISRKSLMSKDQGQEAKQQIALNKAVFEALTPDARAQPEVRKSLTALANAVQALASRTDEITKADLKQISKLQDGVRLFSDLDGLAKKLAELSGAPTPNKNLLSQMRNLYTAQQDVVKPDSFLYASLTEETKDTLKQPELLRLARLIDEFGVRESDGRGDATVKALSAAFGNKENTLAVLDYYQKQNQASLKLVPEESDGQDNAVHEDDVRIGAERGTLTERDAQELTATYKEPNPARPFHNATDRSELIKARRAAGREGRVASMAEYVAQSGESPQVRAAEIRNDLFKRVTNAENRDTDSVQKAIKDLESIPEESRDEDFSKLLASLKSRKTEERTDLPKLRKQLAAVEKAAGVSFKDIAALNRRVHKAELAEEAGMDVEDVANLPKLRKQLAKMEERASKNADKVLGTLSVVMKPKDSTYADDTLMKSFRDYLDKKPNPNIGTPAQRAKAREQLEKIKQTVLTFKLTNGKKLALSAQSMAFNSQAHGDIKTRFLDSLGAVLARPDIAGMEDPSPDTVIVHRAEADKNLTWGELNPDITIAPPMTAKERAKARERKRNAAYGKVIRAETDISTRMRLMSKLRDVQRDYLLSELPAKTRTALGENPSLAKVVEGFPLAERKRMRTEANEIGFETALGWGRDLTKTVTTGKFSTPAAQYKAESSLRVTKDYINEQLDEHYPLPYYREAGNLLSEAENEAFMQAPKGPNVAADISTGEQTLDVLHDRLPVVKGIDGMQEKIQKRIANLTTKIDKLADSVPLEGRDRGLENTGGEEPARKKNVAELREQSKNLKAKIEKATGQERENLISAYAEAKADYEEITGRRKVPANPDMSHVGKKQEAKAPTKDTGKGPPTSQDNHSSASDLAAHNADIGADFASELKRNSFVGARLDPVGAKRAAEAEAAGQSADFIWSTLGWFRGPDGKLRTEIDDANLFHRIRDELVDVDTLNKAEIEANPYHERLDISLSSLLHGIPKLQFANLKLKGFRVTDDMGFGGMLSGATAVYDPSSKRIEFSRLQATIAATMNLFGDPEEVTSLLEKYGGEIEERGIDIGSNWDFKSLFELLHEKKEIDFTYKDLLEETNNVIVSALLHEIQHALQSVEGFENGGNPTSAVLTKFGDMAAYKQAMKDEDGEAIMKLTEDAFGAMKAHYGPEADLDAIGHELYRDIIGEAEAHDVQDRLGLTPEEARLVKPALMDKEKEFLKSFATTAFSIGMRPKKGRPGKIDEKSITDEIHRIRGDKVKVVFQTFTKIGGSGEFSMSEDKSKRLIKIAVNGANPMGTAWHESLHDFFNMLGDSRAERSIKRDLIDASGAPHVKAQLKELLKDHPKAWEQAQNSDEERLAYMYQFWAEGVLKVGPTGTGIFQKLRVMLRDMLGIVGAHTRAEDLLTALHEGKFSDPSVVSEVLFDLKGDRVRNKLERASPAIKDTLDKIYKSAPDRLREYQNEKINELADKFNGPKNGGTGFIQKRFQQEGIWTNKLGEVFKGTTAAERRAAIDRLQAMMPPKTDLEKKIAGFLTDMHGYLTDAGVETYNYDAKEWEPLRQVKNYFPRAFDRTAILKNQREFVDLMRSEGNMTLAAANKMADALTHGTGQLDLVENERSLGYTPFAPHTQARKLTFINQSNASKFAKFQSKDLNDVLMGYVKQAAHRGEYAREFGNDGQQIKELIRKSGITDTTELRDIGKTVQALEGSIGSDMSSSTKELMSGVMTLQNAIVLPLAIFSQMVDPVVLAARSGEFSDAGKAFMTAIKRLGKQKVDGEDMAKMLGIISDDSTLEAMGMAYGSASMSSTMRNFNRVFFKYNGMQGWNNSMRIAATAAGERYLIKNKTNTKALTELGLTPKDIKVDKNGRLNVESAAMQQAMFKFVDGAVLRPSAAQRPVWMSDPKFMLVAHLKQFTFAMNNVVMKRATAEAEDGNIKPWATLVMALPAILAADMAKFALTGGMPQSWGFKDYLTHAVNRSGLLGLGDFGTQAFRGVTYGSAPGEALLGPTFENLMRILRMIGGDPRVDLSDVVRRTVPGARFM